MSAPSRPFLFRFTLAMLGTLLLMAVVFAGLGWIVVRRSGWLIPSCGNERTHQLSIWYEVFLMKMLPDDRDGDGVCDGLELIYATDPRNPTDGFAVLRFAERPTSPTAFVAFCGERLSLRGVQWNPVGEWPWPKGFKAVVSADQPVLLPKKGTGPPTKGPLVVPVNGRGEVEFDILAEAAFGDVSVTLSNAANGKTILNPLSACFPGWRMPLLSASPNESELERVAQHFKSHGRQVRPAPPNGSQPYADVLNHLIWSRDQDALKRVASDNWKGTYIIEASPEQGAESWRPIYLVDPTLVSRYPNAEWSFGNYPSTRFPGYTGPLKYRFAPASPTPP